MLRVLLQYATVAMVQKFWLQYLISFESMRAVQFVVSQNLWPDLYFGGAERAGVAHDQHVLANIFDFTISTWKLHFLLSQRIICGGGFWPGWAFLFVVVVEKSPKQIVDFVVSKFPIQWRVWSDSSGCN